MSSDDYYQPRNLVLLRAHVLVPWSRLLGPDGVYVVIENFPERDFIVTLRAPPSEVARPTNFQRLLEPVTIDPTTAVRSPRR